MKKIICEIDEPKFELFLVELNGYGFEITGRERNKVIFTIYADDKDFLNTKDMVECVFKDLNAGSIVEVQEIKEEDWENIWKENFKPLVVDPFIIIPEWEIYTDNKYIPIKVHIGKAFGTGLHPSTQIMLSLLSRYVKKGDTVLDVGTGTGILAIASKKLGADVTAIDIDKHAIEECELNSWENEIEIRCLQKSVQDVNEKFDVVLANLQIEIFKENFTHLSKIFKNYLIISGIFGKERDEILDMIRENNLKVVEELSMPEQSNIEEDWYGFVIQHK